MIPKIWRRYFGWKAQEYDHEVQIPPYEEEGDRREWRIGSQKALKGYENDSQGY